MVEVRRSIVLVAVLLCAAFAAAPLPASAQSDAPSRGPADTPARSSVIAVGDAVRVTVWRNPELSGQIELAEDGTLIHPLYRSIQAAGLTIPELESQIRDVLLRYESAPQFVVEPLFRIMIGGEVRSPGIRPLPPSTTIAEAVALAGGITERGRADRVRLLRDGRTEHVDLTRPYVELADVRIRSGDQIIVDVRRGTWNNTVRPAITTFGSLASLSLAILRLTRYW